MISAVCWEIAGIFATLIAAFGGASWSVRRTAKDLITVKNDLVKQTAEDLKTQMEPVIRRLELLLHGLEAGGVTRFVHNEDGEITGVILELRTTGSTTSTGSAHLTVT